MTAAELASGSAEVPATGDRSRALRVWAAFAVLLVLAAVPVFSTVLPPLFDYPNHLARMHLLAEGGDAFYALHWRPLPNLAEDLIVPALSRVMPLALAGKLFLILIFALISAGSLWLAREATGGWRLWPLLGFGLLYNRVLLWGFLNYLFGLGLALGGAALWLHLERRRPAWRGPASALMGLACYFAHVEAFALYALILLGVEVPPAWAAWRAGRWRTLLARAAALILPLLPPLLLFALVWEPAAEGGVAFGKFARKADLLFSVFDNYNRTFDVACFVLFLLLLGGLAWRRRLCMAPRIGCAALLVFAAYLALPSQMFTGSGADHRLPPALFLLILSGSTPRLPSRRAAAVIAALAGAVLMLRFGVIERIWRQADRTYQADLAGIDALPAGAKLAVAFPASAVRVVRAPEVHLATLAIIAHDDFVPTLFAYPAQQPIALRPPYRKLAQRAQPNDLWEALVLRQRGARRRMAPVLAQFDYVAVTDRGPVRVPASPCLVPVFRAPSFQIFALRHDDACWSR